MASRSARFAQIDRAAEWKRSHRGRTGDAEQAGDKCCGPLRVSVRPPEGPDVGACARGRVSGRRSMMARAQAAA
jgi:hypothetical protein